MLSSLPPDDDETPADETLESRLAGYLSSGFSDEAARAEMGLTPDAYGAVKRSLYGRERSALESSTNYDHYLNHFFFQRGIINELQLIAQTSADAKQESSAISALKAMSEIGDKLLRTGQDLGVIDRKANETKTALLVGIGNIDDLKVHLSKEVKSIERLIATVGGASMEDVVVPKIHRDAPLSAPKAKTTK